MLYVNGLYKTFVDDSSTVNALQDINMHIEPNEFAVIVGPSGCGKTTLLNIAAGLENATQGTISLNGNIITGPGPDRGMVFQSYTLFPWLTVEQNVAFGPRQQRLNPMEIESKVDHYLKVTELIQFRKMYPKALSGGMKQRVAIARALANDPQVLLMDEPFGALDAQTRVVMQELLLQVWEEDQKTILFITHDIDEAIFLADTIYIMTRQPGTIKKIMQVPLNRPRDHSFIITPEFIRMKKEILELIWEESKQAAMEARG
ncbi:MAG: ABC transporter ATP-binding protein [Syntrophomonadaceae bacterium]|jgi:NitT/TauT family transport system ATP-binding protein|nr:ABC transporter ATP-binding protein [Syntrophomonadaceae bacterium]